MEAATERLREALPPYEVVTAESVVWEEDLQVYTVSLPSALAVLESDGLL